jgi:molecular chaperone HscB
VATGEAPGAPAADPAFLMDMLEQREALSEARQSKDLKAVRRMAAAIEERARGVERALAEGFARVDAKASPSVDAEASPSVDAEASPSDDVDGLAGKVGELKFYRRFLDEVSAIEDEWAA